MNTTILFEEIQGGVKKNILNFFIIISVLFFAGLLIHLFRNQFHFDDPLSVELSSGLFVALLVSILSSMKLITQIRQDGIYVRFLPFTSFSNFLWEDIEDAYVREYNAITEYGGWGIRFGFNGQAYTVPGSTGIQIVLKNGKRFLVTTHKEEEARLVLNKMLRK